MTGRDAAEMRDYLTVERYIRSALNIDPDLVSITNMDSQLGNWYDAAHGFEVAALSTEMWIAALTRLALDYTEMSPEPEPGNLEALQPKCLALRLPGMPDSSSPGN